MTLGQSLLVKSLCGWWWFQGKFSASFGPKPGFMLWIWTWTKLNNILHKDVIEEGIKTIPKLNKPQEPDGIPCDVCGRGLVHHRTAFVHTLHRIQILRHLLSGHFVWAVLWTGEIVCFQNVFLVFFDVLNK